MDDRQIIELYWARSERAIGETDRKYRRYCHYIAASILENDEDAREIVNDTYLKVWNTVPPHRPASLKAYVGKLCRQLALNAYNARHAQKRGGEMAALLAELDECVPDGGGDMGERVALTQALERFLRSLPPKRRVLFVRRYWYASSLADLSREYGISENTLAVSLMRMRCELKDFLQKEGFDV